MVARAAGEAVAVEVFGQAASAAIRAQVARILPLDIDSGGFADVVGRLRRRYPGLRPVLFLSPDEAVAWALIGNRIRVVQAAQLKARLARELGEAVDMAGVTAYAFPGPARLARRGAFPGLSERKVAYVQHSGRAGHQWPARRRVPVRPPARGGAVAAAGAARHRPVRCRAHPPAGRGRAGPAADTRAPAGPGRRAGLPLVALHG